MVDELVRWRIAYDTVSALVALDDNSHAADTPLQPASHPHAAAAADGGGGGGGSIVSCAASYTSSHRDSRDMIQRQRRAQQQQQQQQRSDVTQWSMSSGPPVSGVTSRRHVAGECGDAAVHDGQAMVALYRRLVDTFYMETTLWLYTTVLLHPAARRTRHRLHWLGVVTGRGLQQAAVNVLTGFVAGYRHSRQAVSEHVERALTEAAYSPGRAGRLARLSVELGVVLNPRQMMRSFSTLVRDLVLRATSQTALATTTSRPPSSHGHLYRYH